MSSTTHEIDDFAQEDWTIGPIATADCSAVASVIHDGAQRGFLLERTIEDIVARASDFIAARYGETIVGCTALHRFSPELYEIRSLAVIARYSGRGIGQGLVRHAVELARGRGGRRVFALTLTGGVFYRCGFSRTEKDGFPEKVWADCRLCPRRQCCDEEAVVLNLAAQS